MRIKKKYKSVNFFIYSNHKLSLTSQFGEKSLLKNLFSAL